MTYTENYELPLIEGTDIIDYEPYNESMGKIDEALNSMDDNVQEAKDDVDQMGDTLDQKMLEINQALEQTEGNVNQALEQTTEDLTNMVNNNLSRISKFNVVRSYDVPTETYLYGSESGTLLFPITSLTPSISRVDTSAVGTPQNNRFYCALSSQYAIPVTKIDFTCTVEPTAINETYNGECNTRVQIIRYRAGQSSVTIGECYVNTSNKTTINITCLTTSSGGDSFGIAFISNYSHQVVGKATLTTENVGMNN